mmetsp:Transcript_11764/g.16810  ORF Transcript_11764/g.16810 Transcript_11764/m.16810 type:complete len:169 (+) Transcript_11764:207-713(+)
MMPNNLDDDPEQVTKTATLPNESKKTSTSPDFQDAPSSEETTNNDDDVGASNQHRNKILRSLPSSPSSRGPKRKNCKVQDRLQLRWENMFGRLLLYKQKYGNCLVPNRYDGDPSLGAWVSVCLPVPSSSCCRFSTFLTPLLIAISGVHTAQAGKKYTLFDWFFRNILP